ncbi:MAG: DNA polymerase III subunit beta, partial [Christensenellaceae bacterium]|nr:DNA polymerase III subunit beta [Christensenellaceae bacterium]
MKFICNRQDLAKGISTVIKATYNKFQRSILECIHICAADQVTMDAFDTVTAIRTNIYAQVEEGGETAIPARILQEIVNKMPDGEITIARKSTGSILISGGRSSVTLQEMDAAQFPPFPASEGDAFMMRAGDLKRLVDKTAFSAYMEEDKPIFTGILMESEEGGISAVAIDGVRMAKNSVMTGGVPDVRAIVPAKSLKEVARLLADENAEIGVAFSSNACFIQLENTSIYTRLLNGEFMNYNSIIAKTYKTRVRVETKLLAKSLEMVSVMAREDSSNLVRLSIGQNVIELESTSEYGAAV